MDFSDIFRIVNLVVAVFIILGGVGQLTHHLSIQSIVIAVYLFIFGAGIGLLEFQIPPVFARYASFMFSFIGRGIFYIFIGSIIVGGSNVWLYIVGTIVGLVGIGYVVLEYIPSIEPPANMRDASDSNWGAEQI